MIKKILIIVLILLITSPVYAKRWFQTHSTWYEPVPANPTITANSANYVADLKTNSSSLFTMGGDNPNKEWSVPIFNVIGGETVIVVQLRGCEYSGKPGCSTLDQLAWDNNWNDVPIPTGTVPAGNTNYCAGIYRDGHLAIISADKNTAWEFFGAMHCDGSSPALASDPTDGVWTASSVIKWDLTGDGINYPDGGFGDVRAATVPLLHGLVTYDEVVANTIDHALVFGYHGAKLNGSDDDIYPSDGTSAGPNTRTWPLIIGMRLWLDVDDNYCPNLGENLVNTRVCEALREYGMIFVENVGKYSNSIYMESLINQTDSWTGDYDDGTISGLNISNFKVIDPLEPPFSNTAPILSISQPDGTDDTIAVNASYSITYSLSDAEQIVTLPAKYHTVSGSCVASGTAITGPCAAAPEGTDLTCSWDTSGVSAGEYYICGTATDGSLSASAVSPGVLTIETSPVQPGGFNASGNFNFK